MTLLSTITRKFFSPDGHLYQKSMRGRKVQPSYRSLSQDYSSSPRTEERVILAVSSSSSEKFVLFNIYICLFFQIKGILCEPLQLAPNLKVNTSCSRLPGVSCEFACERGYDLIGSSIRTCNSEGSWTGSQPRCDGEKSLVLRGKKLII